MLNVSGVYSFPRIHSVVMFAMCQQSPLKHDLAKFVSKYHGDCNSPNYLSICLSICLFTYLLPYSQNFKWSILSHPVQPKGTFWFFLYKIGEVGGKKEREREYQIKGLLKIYFFYWISITVRTRSRDEWTNVIWERTSPLTFFLQKAVFTYLINKCWRLIVE